MLHQTLSHIEALDETIMAQAKQRIDQLIKPQGSLGILEAFAVKLAGIQKTTMPKIQKKAIVVMCADHGVCEENIASAPQIVTWMQSKNIARGITGVGALAHLTGTKIYTVDIAVNTHECDELVLSKKIAFGSNNISKGPAMTRDNAIKSLELGIEMAYHAIDQGADLLGIGEMGIGNTTPTTAMLCAFTGLSPEEITGVGANLPLDRVPHKAKVIQQALLTNKPLANDPIDVLAKVGGYDIGGMAGVIIGSAARKKPVVIDGYIATLSAIVACALEPKIKQYIFPSHHSEEKGAKAANDYLGLNPCLHMHMRLGEGSGAVLGFHMLEAACAMNQHMITFEEAGIGVV